MKVATFQRGSLLKGSVAGPWTILPKQYWKSCVFRAGHEGSGRKRGGVMHVAVSCPREPWRGGIPLVNNKIENAARLR